MIGYEGWTDEINKFVEDNTRVYPGSDEDVLTFIGRVLYQHGPDGLEDIRRFFRGGFCYYFALMLKDAFGRGTICNNGGNGQIVWLDGTNYNTDIAYDIEGVYIDYSLLIPVSAMGKMIYDFKHVPGLSYGASVDEIRNLVEYWKSRPAMQ